MRVLWKKDSAVYMSRQSNYCRGVWNFQCHVEHALVFLEDIYGEYAKRGSDVGMEKLKKHRHRIKVLWNYIVKPSKSCDKHLGEPSQSL